MNVRVDVLTFGTVETSRWRRVRAALRARASCAGMTFSDEM